MSKQHRTIWPWVHVCPLTDNSGFYVLYGVGRIWSKTIHGADAFLLAQTAYSSLAHSYGRHQQ